MNRFIFLLILFLSTQLVFSQDDGKFKDVFFNATTFLFEGRYPEAIKELKMLETLRPDNSNIQFQLGFCYLQPPRNPSQAVEHLKKAIGNTTPSYVEGDFKQEKAPVLALKYLADAYHLNYEFKQAIETYKKFKGLLVEKDVVGKADIDKLIASCNKAMTEIQKPVNIKITNIGEPINSRYPDYGVAITADESFIVFTSKRPGSTGGLRTVDGLFYEDIYISEKNGEKWGEPKSIGANVNSADHEASLSFSADGQTLLIYKYDEVGNGDIYYSILNGKNWSTPVKLGSDINTSYQESHATISPDGNYLYFSSNRPGGMGGMDIYFAKKLPNGEWSLVQNCGSTINSAEDENYPFIHPDGVSMYFSSRHNSMGGYDVFVSEKIEDKQWTQPKGMGYPVNTPEDEIFFVPTTDGKRAYYSSFKSDGLGDQDIYMVTFLEFKQNPLTIFKGIVKNAEGNVPENILIRVTDNESGESAGIYSPNSSTGKYIIVLTPGRNYNITFEADDYLFHSENIDVALDSNYYEIERPILLEPLTVGAKVELKNIFFDQGSSTLSAESYVELDKLFKTLKQNPNMIVEIGGHMDAVEAKTPANVKLSQQRSESVVKYLVDRGIDSKQLVSKGYGASDPIAQDKNANGTDNSEGRAKNRRTEMKILSN